MNGKERKRTEVWRAKALVNLDSWRVVSGLRLRCVNNIVGLLDIFRATDNNSANWQRCGIFHKIVCRLLNVIISSVLPSLEKWVHIDEITQEASLLQHSLDFYCIERHHIGASMKSVSLPLQETDIHRFPCIFFIIIMPGLNLYVCTCMHRISGLIHIIHSTSKCFSAENVGASSKVRANVTISPRQLQLGWEKGKVMRLNWKKSRKP